MSEIPLLSEQVPEELLSQDDLFTVVILDQTGTREVFSTQVKLNNPFDFDLSHFLPNEVPMDLPRFFDIAAQVIDNIQDREGVVEDQRVHLVEDFQAENFSDFVSGEVVAFKIIKREPANMDAKATGRPQRAPLFSYDLRTAAYPDKKIVVESRPIDHQIEFSCWSKSAALANRRVLWLENNFITHAWAFKIQGAERFYWKNRGPDVFWTTSGQRLHQRPINFMLRLREFHVVAHPLIRNFNFEVSLIDEDS